MGTTSGGAITILFTHADPEKAASYSNELMTAITNLMETEENDKKNIRLNYLSETLANAISDMDETARNVKNYAMKNSFVAEDNFINQSLKLDKMRTKLAEAKAFEKILGVLVESLEQDKTNLTIIKY